MNLIVGQILRGRRGTYYCLKEALKSSTVFKAQVLPELTTTIPLYEERNFQPLEGRTSANRLCSAVVKTEPDAEKAVALKRELGNYQLPGIPSCRYIRAFHDTIQTGSEANGPNENPEKLDECPALVLEWMEYDLKTIPSWNYRQGSDLPKIIAKSVLSALDFIKCEYDGVHTGECKATMDDCKPVS